VAEKKALLGKELMKKLNIAVLKKENMLAEMSKPKTK